MSSEKAETKLVKKAANGRYIYCVIPCPKKTNFGKIGINGNEVYTIPYKDLSAVVHDCPEEPYKGDDETVKGYIMKHQDVVDEIWGKFDAILPMRFDMIVKNEENVKQWLKVEYENFEEKLKKFRGKVEVGVQIFWDPKAVGEKIADTSIQIRNLREEMQTKPKAMAYYYNMKIQEALKKEIEADADRWFRKFYDHIKTHAEDIRVEKLKKEKDRQMLMNLALLMDRGRIEPLGGYLAEIKEMKVFDVRFTGPWPPYSFI